MKTRSSTNVGRARRPWGKALVTTLVGIAALGLTGAAMAHDDDDWKEWKRHRHHKPHYVVVPPVRYYTSPPVVYVPPRVVYAPPPVVMYPEPVYPSYSGPPSINLTLPLR